MPKDYVTPNVNEDLQGRLQNIEQQILSRTHLLHIIEQLNLYTASSHHRLNPDEKVERMGKDTVIELVRDIHDQITASNVSYSAPAPKLAQQVTAELTKLFIDQNLEERQQQSEDTTKFLQGQLEPARQALPSRKPRFDSSKQYILATYLASRRVTFRSSAACSRNWRTRKMRSTPRNSSTYTYNR